VAIEKTPERAAAGSNPLLAQLCDGLLKRQVWMLSNHSQDLGRELFKRRNASAARLRRGAVIVAPALQPLDRRGYAHLKTFSRLAPRCARSHGFDNAYPQVTRIGLWHCPPPTLRRINAQKTPSSLTVWESPDSNRAKTALTSAVPGQEGHVIKQITQTWKYTSPNKEFDGALGIAVDQQDIVGDQLTQKGYAMSRSTNGDETYFTFQSTGKLSGQELSGSGTWQWTGGTGKFKGVKGGGPFTYKAGPNLPLSFEWSGEAEM
jgi:hypothetical protein